MINVPEKKEQILKFIESQGPTIPVRIAKKIDMSPVFASAILSEMLQEKRLKLSSLKIGASPLYLIPGQEKLLEESADYLKNMEKEAFLKLKKQKIIKDSTEEPAIRVALRSIKDFAIPFRENEELFWKYAFSKEDETKEKTPRKEIKEEAKKEILQVKKEERQPLTKPKPEKKVEEIFDQDPFEKEIKNFIKKLDLEFLNKIQSDKKEIVAKTLLKTPIGQIEFLLIAKNKKTLNKDEVTSALQRAKYEKMPCIIIIRREPSRSILQLVEENKNLLKIKVLPE